MARKWRTVEYATWVNMISRCENPKRKEWHRYGGRGIKVCARWRSSFAAFLADMGKRPSDQHSIDRIDNDGNYEPGNCRWATRHQQFRNTSKNKWIELPGGGKKILSDLARDAGVDDTVMNWRIKRQWDPKRLTDGPRKAQKFRHGGKMLNIYDLSDELGIPRTSLYRRIQRHGNLEDAVRAYHANKRGNNRKNAKR